MFKAIGVTFSSSLLTIICHFLTLTILIRVMDATEMGIYFIALLISHLLVLVTDLGLEVALVKKYPEADGDGRARLLRTTLVLRFATCAGVTALFGVAMATASLQMLQEIRHVAVLTLVFYWLHAFRGIQFRVLQVEKLFSAYAGTQALAAILKVALVVAVAPIAAIGVGDVLIIEIVAILASMVFASSRMWRQLRMAYATRMSGARELVRFGFPLYLNAIVNLGNEKISAYIVAAIGGPVAIAFFSIAERLADAGRRLFASFVSVYLPMQTGHFAASDVAAAKHLASRSMLWVTVITAGATVAFAVVREPLFHVLFTREYVAAADTAVMFFCVLMLYALQALMGYFSVAGGYNYFPVKVSLISSVFNVAMTIWLYKAYGYEGAAGALIATQALMCVLYYAWLRRAGLELDVMPVVGVLILFGAAIAWIITFSSSIGLSMLAVPVFAAALLAFIPQLRADLVELMQRYGGALTGSS